MLTGHSNNNITLASHSQDGPALATQPPPILRHRQENQFPSNSPYTHPMPYPTNYSNPSVGGPGYPPAGAPSYPPPRTPPPPPPPSNVGYMPTFLPRTDRLSETYINMPPSGRGGGPGPGFGIGLGAGALAAGAVIFGDDFMSGFDVPAGLQDASLTISTDPPF